MKLDYEWLPYVEVTGRLQDCVKWITSDVCNKRMQCVTMVMAGRWAT